MSSPLNLLKSTASVPDAVLLASLTRGSAPSSPLNSSSPITTETEISETLFNPTVLSSSQFSGLFNNLYTDLIRLFAAANFNDQKISALESYGLSDLSRVENQLESLSRQILNAQNLQSAYKQGYSITNTVDFLTTDQIETDPLITSGYYSPSYNSIRGSIALPIIENFDTLELSTGTPAASGAVTFQIGYPDQSYRHLRQPQFALDGSGQTYWAESILSDQELQILWPTVGSAFLPAAQNLGNITSGAVGEYTISYPQPTDWTTIQITPFGSQAVNLAGILVLKTTPVVLAPGEYYISAGPVSGYNYYLITEYNTQRVNNYLFLEQQVELAFPEQFNCLKIILAFHQPHFTREVFSLPQSKNIDDALWQQLMGNIPQTGLSNLVPSNSLAPSLDLTYTSNPQEELINNLTTAISASGSLGVKHTYVKYHYSYGAYNIGVYNRRYGPNATYISTPLTTTENIAAGTIFPQMDIPQELAVTASSWVGARDLIPLAPMEIPIATVEFDMTYGQSSTWYPFCPDGLNTVSEPYILSQADYGNVSRTTTTTLRLQAIPQSPVYLASFDGQGNCTLLGGVHAPNVTDSSTPTTITWGFQLNAPGNYVVIYKPVSSWSNVNLGTIAEANSSATSKTYVATGQSISTGTGIILPSTPYIDPAIVTSNFEPNGNPLREYVPISVKIDGMPFVFPNLVDSTGHSRMIASYIQDTDHANDLYAITQASLEILTTNDPNPSLATNFQSIHANWDRDATHTPQLFLTGSVNTNSSNTNDPTNPTVVVNVNTNSAPTPIPQYDINGNAIWAVDYGNGSIRFLGNPTMPTAPAGQLAATYFYQTTSFAPPVIVNRTSFSDFNNSILTPFDTTAYPVIEYQLVDNKLFFNLDLPSTAIVTINYQRLFDSIRIRSIFTRVDPYSEAATPEIYGFLFAGADANSTSVNSGVQNAVVWGDLELTFLGQTQQVNPAASIGGSNLVASSLPPFVNFQWYRVVNAGPLRDNLRAQYDSSNNTTLYLDLNNDQFIQPNISNPSSIGYQIIPGDGSLFISLDPGDEIIVGLTNTTGSQINAATIYSGWSVDYLQSENWLVTASQVSSATSVASVVLS